MTVPTKTEKAIKILSANNRKRDNNAFSIQILPTRGERPE
jgi:hypothetical protein